jgi:CheY-like chemotaxis protein
MAEESTKKRKILVFEDDPAFRSSYISALEARGFSAKVVSSPAEITIEAIKEFAPDIISLDVTMPHTSGLDAYRIYKNDPSLRDIPVVFVSSRTDVESEVKSLGCKAFFHKFAMPITEIVQQIDNII